MTGNALILIVVIGQWWEVLLALLIYLISKETRFSNQFGVSK